MRRLSILLFSMLLALSSQAAGADTVSHVGFSANLHPARLISMDQYQRLWQKKKNSFSTSAELTYTPLPSDSNAFASDYNYPTFSFGVRLSWNDITMHRNTDPAWGLAEEVDYDSHMGNTATLYATFTRPFFRRHHWSADYTLGTGVGYAHRKYDNRNNIDDELIGSHFLIYFTAGLHATYMLTDNWGLRAGIDFFHHSNGAMERPNKGANIVGPSLGIAYMPSYRVLEDRRQTYVRRPFQPYWYANVGAAIGLKTLNEDWQLTQFGTPSTDPSYRTSHFHHYLAYAFQADLMRRYARRWASGAGIDLFYATYASRVREIDRKNGLDLPHHPWSVGLAGKHEVFYGNLSVAMSLGLYLHRELGDNAKEIERPYYERIGVHYTFPRLGRLKVGLNVKAHATKADYTELMLTYPIRLTSRRSAE